MQMQQAERQPFFKPLDNNANSNFFSYENQNKHRAPQETPPRKANSSNTFFAPVSQKQKEHEMIQDTVMNEKTASDRLSDLHTKLHGEAEKIRKWKVQTEIEIKQKDRKIQESSMSIDSLRKSVLELQMQNETLGMKLKEELDNREEIVQKINATRDICNLLKEHTSKVEKKLQHCESERIHLRINEKENVRHLEDLTSKFTQLQLKSKESHNNLMNMLQLEQAEKMKLSAAYEDRLVEATELLNTLQYKCKEKEDEIAVIRNEMQTNFAHIKDIKAEHCALEKRFNEASTLASQQKEHIDKVTIELKEASDARSDLATELRDTQEKLQNTITSKEKMAKNFDETEKLYIEKVKSLKEAQARTEDELEKERSRVADLDTKLKKAQSSIEELKGSKDMLILERTEAQDQRKELEVIRDNLEREISQLSEKYSSLSEETSTNEETNAELHKVNTSLQITLETLNKQIEQLSDQQDLLNDNIKTKADQLHQKQEEIHRLKEDLKEALQREEVSYKRLDDLKAQLNNESDEHLTLNQEIEDLQDEIKSKNKELTGSKTEINKLKKEIEKLSKKECTLKKQLAESEEHVSGLKEEVEKLDQLRREKEDDAANLLEEGASTTKNLQIELSQKQKHAETLDTLVKNLKSEITEKNKKIKEIEKELKSSKGKLTSQTKVSSKLEDEVNSLKEELEKASEEKEDLHERMKEMEEKLKKNCDEVKEMRKETNDLKKTTNQAVKDKEKANKEFEFQMNEMMATLEKYKKENQKIVEQKDKELEHMKSKQEVTSNKKYDDEIAILKDQVEELKKDLESKESDEEKTKKRHEDDIEKMDQLKTDLDNKVAEVNKLSTLVENLRQETDVLKVEKMEWSRTKSEEVKTIKENKPTTSKPVTKVLEKKRPQEVPRTPTVKKTPTMGAVTPQYRTPQRSILKQPDSAVSKKRRVVFAGSEDDNSGSESSSSELMEVDLDEIETRLKIKTPKSNSLPLHLRPSPKIRQSPIVVPSQKSKTMSMKPVPRGHSAWAQKQAAQEQKKSSVPDDETYGLEDQNISLYNDDGSKKKKIPKSTGNVRKTPNRPTGKFFKSSPNDRRKMQSLKESKKQQDTSWFDTDNVFGFDMDD